MLLVFSVFIIWPFAEMCIFMFNCHWFYLVHVLLRECCFDKTNGHENVHVFKFIYNLFFCKSYFNDQNVYRSFTYYIKTFLTSVYHTIIKVFKIYLIQTLFLFSFKKQPPSPPGKIKEIQKINIKPLLGCIKTDTCY